jgi:hypothetical protein
MVCLFTLQALPVPVAGVHLWLRLRHAGDIGDLGETALPKNLAGEYQFVN